MENRKIVLVAHNIRSLWNVGSFFRSADAFQVSHVHLTGYTGSPPRSEISKTALGAEGWIPWTSGEDPLAVIASRKKEGFCIVALEITPASVDLFTHRPDAPVCLILGHEVSGVSDELLNAADVTAHIPMLGKKASLNVSVAAGIALHHYRHAA